MRAVRQSWLAPVVLLVLSLVLLRSPDAALAMERCQVSGVTTDTSHVTDVLETKDALWVATTGGVEEYERSTKALVKRYTTLDGLAEISVDTLAVTSTGQLIARTRSAECALFGSEFRCAPRKNLSGNGTRTSLRFSAGFRITAERSLAEGKLQGTAGGGALLAGAHLGAHSELPDPHVTALAFFRDRLWVGTFNGGLAVGDSVQGFRPTSGPGKFINALFSTPSYLYVGTSQGLFRSADGSTFLQVPFVEDAVVGIASDGISVWASTPGALYRIKDGPGPLSDVWWIAGGSRSLQKVSASPGSVWLGSEDRGAIHMKVGPQTVARDKPFSVFDRSVGLPSSWSLSVAALWDGGALVTTLREGLIRILPDGSFRSIPSSVSPWGLVAYPEATGVWIGSQQGATHLDLKTERTTDVQGLPDERVHVFLRDPQSKRLYIGTENGLAWCAPQAPQSTTGAVPGGAISGR